MKKSCFKSSRKITALLSAILLTEQLASGAAIYAHAEDVTEITVDQNVTSSWYGGCSAEITVTNQTAVDTEGWYVTFSSSDEITSLWNGTITETDKTEKGFRYTVEAAAYNAVIPAGGATSIGYVASGEDHNVWDVKAFAINGAAQESVNNEETGTTETTENTETTEATENTEITENTETTENTENIETTENTEVSETNETTETSETEIEEVEIVTDYTCEYVTRGEILEWILKDGRDFEKNYSFEVPQMTVNGDYRGYDTKMNPHPSGSYVGDLWVLYNAEEMKISLDEQNLLGDYSNIGAYYTIRNINKYDGFGFYSNDPTKESYSADNSYDPSKISAPVFKNLKDYEEFKWAVRHYFDDPTEYHLNYLKVYLATTEKMLNPVGVIPFSTDTDEYNVYFADGYFNPKYVGNNFGFDTCPVYEGDTTYLYWDAIYGSFDLTEVENDGHGYQMLGYDAQPWVRENGELVRKQEYFDGDVGAAIYLPIRLTEEQLTNHKVYIHISVMANGMQEEAVHALQCIAYAIDFRYNTNHLQPVGDVTLSHVGTHGQYVTLIGQLAPRYNDSEYLNKTYHCMPEYIRIYTGEYEEVRINKIWITVE